ncbi:MAG TPA: GH25 family lysozyme [Gaiellaceae bacterium]|nr:GH25 family lysozyme [Gaiellaceae bacterium]
MRSRRGALIGMLAVAALVGAARGNAATYALGVDVSHYQGAINWPQVAGSSTFAFEKATEGKTLVDMTYPVNRMGAESVGIKVGAYHFARPVGSGDSALTADAITQADFFLSIAQPQAGELPPVLDLEVTGGLKPPDLLTWTSAWLEEIYARTGVRALVYTSPNFWKNSLADSGVPALDGTPLWVAHWTTAGAPLVPGGNWGGAGWSFWQYSSHATVTGITTQVDRDRFHLASVTGAVIKAYPGGLPVSSTPPTIVGAAQSGKRVTAVPGEWSGGKPLTFSFQWQRCDASGLNCVPIPGATTNTYLPTTDDLGHALTVAVSAQATAGVASAVSPATLAVVTAGSGAARPAATTAPSVTGVTEAGQTLTASVGSWSGAPTAFAYQWQRCHSAGADCAAILGATASTYQLSAADIGAYVATVVTATGKGGSASATAVVPTAVTAAPVPAAVPSPAVVSQGVAGAVSTADGAATLVWQPGSLPVASNVTLTHTGQTVTFSVDPALARLTWPVELTYSAPTTDVIGYSTDGKVWLPATPLKADALPVGASVGTFLDATGLPHVLLGITARIRLFTPGKWGDPRLVAAAPPQPRLVGSLHAKRLRSGVVVLTGRVLVPSQALLTMNVPGRTSNRRLQLLKPGGVPVRITLHIPRGATGTLRVAARDPWGRRAQLLARFHGP